MECEKLGHNGHCIAGTFSGKTCTTRRRIWCKYGVVSIAILISAILLIMGVLVDDSRRAAAAPKLSPATVAMQEYFATIKDRDAVNAAWEIIERKREEKCWRDRFLGQVGECKKCHYSVAGMGGGGWVKGE